MIEVILLERIERLGQMGQVVKVRPGFARNFLLPHNKALRATKTNLDLFEKQRAELETRNAAERAKAEKLADKMESLKLIVIRQAGETGHLYGSVTARDVADAAKTTGQQLEHGQVQIDTPIKTVGLFPVKVKLHPEVTIKLTINVARTQEEAQQQSDKAAVAAIGSKPANDAGVAPATDEAPAAETTETEDTPKKKAKSKKAATSGDEAEEAAEAKPKKAKAKKKADE